MRTYLLEDIYDKDYKTIIKAFDDLGFKGPIDGIYYIPVPKELLQGEQLEHVDDCGPHFMALECIKQFEDNKMKLELLVRATSKIRCSCVSYATPKQREHMIEYLDQFIEELEVSI